MFGVTEYTAFDTYYSCWATATCPHQPLFNPPCFALLPPVAGGIHGTGMALAGPFCVASRHKKIARATKLTGRCLAAQQGQLVGRCYRRRCGGSDRSHTAKLFQAGAPPPNLIRPNGEYFFLIFPLSFPALGPIKGFLARESHRRGDVRIHSAGQLHGVDRPKSRLGHVPAIVLIAQL